jgi:ABC-type antimicrobial peptide transport system permease subunit
VFQIHDSRAEALAFEEEMLFASIIMEAIGWVAIFMAVLSMVSSTSSIYLERTREVAIMRVLGLYNREVNRLFYLEILILLFAAGLSGSCSGYLIAWLLYSQINLFIQIPPITPLPIATLVRTFGISIFFLTIGLWLMFKRFHNKFTLVEVLKGD